MSWMDQIKGNSPEWLLDPAMPGVRYLALRDLFNRPGNNPELLAARKAAHEKGPIATILAKMHPDGYWVRPGPGYNPKYRSAVWSLILLAQLGASVSEDRRIAQACAYMLDHALTVGGQFTMSGAPSGTIDCLQGNLCRALLDLGSTDARLETAFDWMARSVTGEGVAPADEREAPTRYYAYKCGPTFACGANGKYPCAWGAVKVMLAFGSLPRKCHTKQIEDAVRQGVDFIFSADPATAKYPTRTGSKPNRSWWKFGFPVFYVTDLLQLAEALIDLGYGSDQRLSQTLEIIREKQDAEGRWVLDYDYSGKTWVEFGVMKQPNPWVTLRALRVLKKAVETEPGK